MEQLTVSKSRILSEAYKLQLLGVVGALKLGKDVDFLSSDQFVNMLVSESIEALTKLNVNVVSD